MLRKSIVLSLMLFIFAIITSACGSGGSSGSCEFTGYPNFLGKLTLSKDKFTIKKGSTDKIIAYVDGKDKTDEAIFTVKSEKEETNSKNIIANVDKGNITAIKAGTSIINVHVDNTEEDKTFTVNVIDPALPTLEVVKTLINIELGTAPNNIEHIIVTLDGKDVTDEVSFTSTDENVATIDENGNINIVGEGETQIIIHLDGANDQIVTIKVTLPELEISKKEINLQVGEEAENQQKNTDDITVKLRGEDQIGEAMFVSSDPNVATVDQDGHITAIAEGEAIISVIVEGAKKSEIKVNVYDPDLHKIILQSNSLVSLQVGQTEQIAIFIKEENKTKQAKYTIEDDTIASVSDTGIITALKEGTTKIKVHLDDTEEDIEITVDVYDPELHTLHYTSADITTQNIDEKEYMIIYEGETGHIQILVAGEDKTITGVYTSGNTEILTVENTQEKPGLITAIKKGETTITLHHEEALEGDVVVNVLVKEKPQLITTELNIILGYTEQIVIKNLSGEDITNKFTFTSDDPTTATVDSNGKVTLLKEHNTSITAVYDDGMRLTTYQIPIKAQKTLTTNAGITATAFSANQTQDIIKILMDTGMISNENDVDNIVRIDTTNGLTEIKITIDREDGTQVAVVAYENGEVKYIQTGTVQNKQVTVNVGTSNKNIVATTDNNGNVTSTVITPGFYDNNNQLLASWDTVVGWGWNYSKNYNYWDSFTSMSYHIAYIANQHNTLQNATKLVIPNSVTTIGAYAFASAKIPLNTVVYPNSFTNISQTPFYDSNYARIKNYTINSNNQNYDSIDGVIYNENHTTCYACPMNKNNVTIPEGVTTINNGTFTYNISTSVGPNDSNADIKLPNTIKTIKSLAFLYMYNLKWVEFPNMVEYLGSDLIHTCTNINSVFIPSSVKTIEKSYNSHEGYYEYFAQWAGNNLKIYVETGVNTTNWSDNWNARGANGTNKAPVTWNISRATYRSQYRN